MRPNSLLTGVDGYAKAAAATPLGWPIFWISVALAALIAGQSAGVRPETRAIAASAFFYGLSYLVVGVKTVMIVGAGKMSELSARHLRR